ncbi:uncharacterized protein [Dermacentor albipictus]|uniref:uncharacterized protein isoform X2 n=1 Tax=Dermacentor albipictus TaxID=60249 RepID=UPI0038FCDDDB
MKSLICVTVLFVLEAAVLLKTVITYWESGGASLVEEEDGLNVTRVLPSLSEVMPQKKDTGFWTGTLVIQAFAKRAVFLALLPWCGPKDYPKFHAVLVLGHVLLETAVMWKAVEATGKLRPGGPGTVLVVTFWYYIIEIAFLIIHVIARDLSVPYAMSSNSWFAYTQIYSASRHSRRTWSTVSLSPHLPQVGGSLPQTRPFDPR